MLGKLLKATISTALLPLDLARDIVVAPFQEIASPGSFESSTSKRLQDIEN